MLSTTLNTLNLEQSKFFIRRPFWMSVGVIIVMMLLAFLVVQFAVRDEGILLDSGTTWAQTGVELAGQFSQLVLLLTLVLAGAFTGMEYSWRTLSLALGRGTPRSIFLGAKLLVICAAAALLILLTNVLVAGGTLLTYRLLGESLVGSNFDLAAFTLSLGRVFVTFLPYIGLTVFLSILGRSSAVGIGGGLVFTLLLETLLSFALGFLNADLPKFLPTTLAENFLTANRWSGEVMMEAGVTPRVPVVEPMLAAFGLFAWAALFLFASLFIFRRQDLNA